MKGVEVTISKDGGITIEPFGYKGKACLEVTKKLEDKLQGNVVIKEEKPEMFEQAETTSNAEY